MAASLVAVNPSFANVMGVHELTGKTICWGAYGEHGISTYAAGGRYSIRLPSGKVRTGHWTMSSDGTVSTIFDNDGHQRVDKFDLIGDEVVDLYHPEAVTGYINC
jgi:hypothetical protein